MKPVEIILSMGEEGRESDSKSEPNQGTLCIYIYIYIWKCHSETTLYN
jgi:hypothetical protein